MKNEKLKMSHSAAVDDKNFIFAPNSSLRSQFSIFSLFCQVLPNGIFNFQLALLGAAERNF
jgi:hypothetical protein